MEGDSSSHGDMKVEFARLAAVEKEFKANKAEMRELVSSLSTVKVELEESLALGAEATQAKKECKAAKKEAERAVADLTSNEARSKRYVA